MNIVLECEIEMDYKKQAFLRDNGKCRYCDLDFLSSLTLFWSYEVDHIIARSEQGPDTLENVVTCCGPCNRVLTRAGHLKTFDQRFAYVQSQTNSRRVIYELWTKKLRG